MCGINAIYAFHPSAPLVDEDELLRTREAMRLRGPDAAGHWLSEDRRIGLGHRRLSIIDVSDRANQPMQSREGDLAIVFNGEIYNYRELRDELGAAGENFDTTSDTEVLLRMYRQQGSAMLPKLRGMFAFCIWDARTRTMFLARDPYGIKPLYYANDQKTVRVASQVKALLAGGAVSTARDPAGIAGFLLRGSVPRPFTMYWSIRAVPAGSWMTITSARPAEAESSFSLAAEFRDALHSSSQSQRAQHAVGPPSSERLNSEFGRKAAGEVGWKVARSGTGGDELFGGCSSFRITPRLVRTVGIFRHLPSAARLFERAYSRVMPKRRDK